MVDAMAQGHRAAEAIDAYLRGAKLAPTNGASALETASNPKPDAAKQERVKMPQAAPAARLRDFTEIDLGYSVEQAWPKRSGAWPAVCAASACSA